jgi:hypothetical protein
MFQRGNAGVAQAACSLRQSQYCNHLEKQEPKLNADVLLHIFYWRSAMSKLGILGATALSLTIALATPALAQMGHGGGGAHFGGGAGFRGAHASMGAGQVGAVSGGSFAGRGSGQFAQGGYQGGYRGGHGWRHRGFGPGIGFAAGLAAGSAPGYGYGGTYDPYYYDDYAYNDYYDNGYPGVVVSSGAIADPAYCAQRYKSYDPASGTYLGYDGLRHPCGE